MTSASRYIKIDYTDYPKSLISRIIEVCCNYTCYCVNMVSVTSASRYITSASRYHQLYQSRSSKYIRGLIQWNFAGWSEAVPIDMYACKITL